MANWTQRFRSASTRSVSFNETSWTFKNTGNAITAGDSLFFAIGQTSGQTVSAVSDNLNGSWTKVNDGSNTGIKIALWWFSNSVVAASGAMTVTVTWSAANAAGTVAYFLVDHVPPNSAPTINHQNVATGGPSSASSVTVTNDTSGNLLVFTTGWANNDTSSAPNEGMTLADDASGTAVDCTFGWNNNATNTGSRTPQCTISGATFWVAVGAFINSAAAASAPRRIQTVLQGVRRSTTY